MSIRFMSAIWDCGPTDKSELLVLLALADYANNEGESWPSVEAIAAKSRLSDRGVRKVLSRLEGDGWIEISRGNGRRNTSVYRIKNPEHGSETLNPVQPQNPEPRSETLNTVPETLNGSAKNPEPRSAEPLEPSKEPSVRNDAREIREALRMWAGPEAVDSFIKYRRKSKSPLTVTAARRISKTLNDILSKGGDPDDALGLAEERGWRGLQADWYFKSRGVPNGPQNRTDPAIEQISRLAGLGAASGNAGR